MAGRDAVRDRAERAAHQSQIHESPGLSGGNDRHCRLTEDGRELDEVDGEVRGDRIVRGAHIGHERRQLVREYLGKSGRAVALALIPDKTCHRVLFKRVHIVVVHIPRRIAVAAGRDVVALLLRPFVAAGRLRHAVGQEGADRLSVSVDLDHPDRYAGRPRILRGEQIAQRGEVLHGGGIRTLPGFPVAQLGADLLSAARDAGFLHQRVIMQADGRGRNVVADSAALRLRHSRAVRRHGVRHVGLPDDHEHIADQHVLEHERCPVGVDAHTVALLRAGIQPCAEGQRPCAVLNPCLREHSHEFARHLVPVLGRVCKAPHPDVLAPLDDHVG